MSDLDFSSGDEVADAEYIPSNTDSESSHVDDSASDVEENNNHNGHNNVQACDNQVNGNVCPTDATVLWSSLSRNFQPRLKVSDDRTPVILHKNINPVLRKKKDGSREDVPCPESIAFYNQIMGGVFLSDQKVGKYDFNRKSQKWWRKVFFEVVMMSCCEFLDTISRNQAHKDSVAGIPYSSC